MGEWLLCGIHDASPKVTDESEGLLAKCTEGLHCYWHKVSNIKDLCMYNFCAHSVSQTWARISRYMNVYPHGNTKIVNFKLKMVFALMSWSPSTGCTYMQPLHHTTSLVGNIKTVRIDIHKYYRCTHNLCQSTLINRFNLMA